MELQVLHADEVVLSRAIGASPLNLGRSASNDVVLRHGDVSGHHALVYQEAGQVLIKDLGSSNGTFVNDARIREPTPVAEGDTIRLGQAAALRVAQGADLPHLPLQLERVDGAAVWPVHSEHVSVPGEADAFIVVTDNDLWLAIDGVERASLTVGEPFDVDGVAWVLREVSEATPKTLRPTPAEFPYELVVSLDDGWAKLSRTGATVSFDTDNRAALMWALGKRWLDDGEGRARGWVDDTELARMVWGRAHREQGANNLHVLVHRVRREAAAAGFDRWFLQKRSGRTRVRCASVRLVS